MFKRLKRLFHQPVAKIEETSLIVSEGVAGYFHYHISTKNGPTLALCGAKTMHTSIPLNAWGVKDHLPSKWCENCELVAKELE